MSKIALAIISFLLFKTSSLSRAKTDTSFNAFSIIGSCVCFSAPNSKAISSVVSNHKGIFKTSSFGNFKLVVYVLKLISGTTLLKSLNAL